MTAQIKSPRVISCLPIYGRGVCDKCKREVEMSKLVQTGDKVENWCLTCINKLYGKWEAQFESVEE